MASSIGFVGMAFPYRLSKLRQIFIYNFSLCRTKSTTVLGIETSCDDTGCALVESSGRILGESLVSQGTLHLRYGGVNPIVARDLHRDNIELAVSKVLAEAEMNIQQVDSIAVTTKPGLLACLQIGVKYAKHLSRTNKIPLIPIHHMEAHALVARMYYNIPFPFLVLLISGGHCLLAVAKDVDKFMLLGKSLDNAPGEVMDKAARRMKLRNIPAYSQLVGGRAIEEAAKNFKNISSFDFPTPLVRQRDCNFSFSGLKDSLIRKLLKKEEEHKIIGAGVIPEVSELCAAYQLAIAEHLVHRTERAMLFCEKNNLVKERSLIVSGGVACNNFIFKSMELVGNKLGYKVYRPPPRVCTDNGVMIAWNGLEQLKKYNATVNSISLDDIDPEAPFGEDFTDEVLNANLSTKVTRLKTLLNV